jgi:hypothetical protein
VRCMCRSKLGLYVYNFVFSVCYDVTFVYCFDFVGMDFSEVDIV